MVKRCIGIDIGSSHLCAVQLLQTNRQLVIEKAFSTQIRRSTYSTLAILKSLTGQHGFDRRVEIAVTLPHGSVFFRDLEADSVSAGRLSALNISALEHSFPIEPDEIIAQAYSKRELSDDKHSVLVAATTKTALSERLGVFKGVGITPVLVDAVILAVCAATKINHPEVETGTAIIVYIDESYLSLAVTHKDNILIVRSIPVTFGSENNADVLSPQLADLLSHEIEITWRKVLGDGEIEQNCRIYVAAIGRVCDDFKKVLEEKLNCQVVAVDPHAKVKTLMEHSDGASVCVAEGLALRLLVPEKTAGINFLESANSSAKRTLNLKKELIICAILAAAIVLISLGGLFMRLLMLESEYAHVKDEIRDVFQRTLPKETSIINPLAQLEQKLQSLRKNYSSFSPVSENELGPLEVLYAISTTVSSEANISIDSMLITSESVRLTGISESFESVYNWQRALGRIRGFSSVEAENVGKDSKSQLVHFTMIISLAVEPK